MTAVTTASEPMSAGRRPAALLARAAVVLACAAAVVVFVGRRSDAGDCERARTALFSAGLKGTAPASTVRELTDACRDPEQIAVAAAGVTAGHPDVAAALARTAVRRGPDEFAGWAALAGALRRTDPDGAARAARRATELNPRWVPPTATTAAPPTTTAPQG
jgi:hypothetical protein